MRKYTLDKNDSREILGRTVYRIKRISDGLIGGWLQSEGNLSHTGNCFAYDDCVVMEDAFVTDHAEIRGNVLMKDFARIGGCARAEGEINICGNTVIRDKVQISGRGRIDRNVKIFGKAHITDKFYITDFAWIADYAMISGHSYIGGKSKIFGQAKVHESAITDSMVYGYSRVKNRIQCKRKVGKITILNVERENDERQTA